MASCDGSRLSPILDINRPITTTVNVTVDGQPHRAIAGLFYYLAVTFGEALRAAAGRQTSRASLGALVFRSRRLRVLPGGDEPARRVPNGGTILRPGHADDVTLLRQPVQEVRVSYFKSLRAGDILFIDSTHVAKAGSDVCWL